MLELRTLVFRPAILSVLLATVVSIPIVSADDWPHWMGPTRDNVWHEVGIVERFPEGGPKVLWRTPIAGGYAGPAVAGGKVFITDYVTSDNVKVDNFSRNEFTGEERVLCLDEATGKVIWTHKYPVKYSISYPAGPRCTPTVDGDRVYTLGAEGQLICFNIADGGIVWEKNLPAEYKAKSALWGYSAHPRVDGDMLLTLAGGPGSHIVALDKRTGKEIWKSLTSPETGYSPPTIFEHGGVRQLILLRPNAVSSVDPATGHEYWSLPYEASSGSIIMSPLLAGNFLYVAGYNNHSVLIELDPSKPAAKELWRDKQNVICPVNVQPYLVDDIIYGMDQKGVLRAIRLPEGEKLWETAEPTKRRFDSGTAFLVRNADRVILFNELGELIFAKISPTGYEEIDRTKVIDQTNFAFGRDVVWSMPAFANRHAYIRNDKELICVDLAK